MHGPLQPPLFLTFSPHQPSPLHAPSSCSLFMLPLHAPSSCSLFTLPLHASSLRSLFMLPHHAPSSRSFFTLPLHAYSSCSLFMLPLHALTSRSLFTLPLHAPSSCSLFTLPLHAPTSPCAPPDNPPPCPAHCLPAPPPHPPLSRHVQVEGMTGSRARELYRWVGWVGSGGGGHPSLIMHQWRARMNGSTAGEGHMTHPRPSPHDSWQHGRGT